MLWNLSYRGENLDSVLFIILFSLTVVSNNFERVFSSHVTSARKYLPPAVYGMQQFTAIQ
jgi:hypothetical protein